MHSVGQVSYVLQECLLCSKRQSVLTFLVGFAECWHNDYNASRHSSRNTKAVMKSLRTLSKYFDSSGATSCRFETQHGIEQRPPAAFRATPQAGCHGTCRKPLASPWPSVEIKRASAVEKHQTISCRTAHCPQEPRSPRRQGRTATFTDHLGCWAPAWSSDQVIWLRHKIRLGPQKGSYRTPERHFWYPSCSGREILVLLWSFGPLT